MNIPFWKMHGASNDFVMVDDRGETFPVNDREWIAHIGARRTGVGCEGIILIQPSKQSDFRMRFFNPDGSEVEMCGNGARCVARLANEIGAAPKNMTIETIAGELRAEARGDTICLWMTAPKDWRLNQTLQIEEASLGYSFVNSGVPHAVVLVDNLKAFDVKRFGALIRYHKDFAPAGTNANFVAVTGTASLAIRTYERGVEDETLACGTGMTAAGLIAGKLGLCRSPVKVTCASGDTLEIGFTLTDDSAKDVTLTGPAVPVFTGNLTYPSK